MGVTAYFLIRAQSGKLWEICEKVREIEGIGLALVVTGTYDLIAHADLPSPDDLRKVTEAIHNIDGIIRTETSVVL
ncbi:MAG: Lrp/AsnC ligand binding domain-containing protein [Candidatus Thorarchaeota archaeon]